jgi:hypothetical protein
MALLAPHLTIENRDALLARATHKSKREIEELVAEIAPRPDVPERVQRLPDQAERQPPIRRTEDQGRFLGSSVWRGDETPAGRAISSTETGLTQLRPDGESADRASVVATVVATARPSKTAPLAPGRYLVQFTASAELRDKLERLRALLRSELPEADLTAVIEQAVTEKLERIEARRFDATKAPRSARPTGAPPRSRHVPAALRRAVRERDGDRCGFIEAGGRRCSERHGLEYHHRHPFGMGGGHTVANVGLLCRTHNAWLAEQDYGKAGIERHKRATQTETTRAPAVDWPGS